METIKIEERIVSQRILDTSTPTPPPATIEEPTIHDVPLMSRPDILRGKTYKINPGEHAVYVTINDALFYEGTAREQYAPYEIFLNTKDTTDAHHYMALTRMLSSVFRRGGDVRFVVDELTAIYNPKGGYWVAGKYMNSVHQEIGLLIHGHIRALKEENEARQKSLQHGLTPMETPIPSTAPHKEVHGAFCTACKEHGVVMRDGCPTCVHCGAGKCG